MSQWQEAPLGEICNLKAGSVFKLDSQGRKEGDYPFVKVSDMNLTGNEIYIRVANNWITEQERKSLRVNVHPKGATVLAKIGIALTYNRRRLLVRETVVDNNMMSAISSTIQNASRFPAVNAPCAAGNIPTTARRQ